MACRRVLALALIAAAASTLGAAAQAPLEPLPDGCERSRATYRCDWTYVLTGSVDLEHEIPGFPRTLATVTVFFEGIDRGWTVTILDPEKGHRLSSSEHANADLPVPAVSKSTSTHHFPHPDGTARTLRWSPAFLTGGVFPRAEPDGDSSARVRIVYVAEEIPLGVAPPRPAATREHPHLDGSREIARQPALDIVAAWFDDPRLGDGLFDATIAVEDLSHVDFNFSTSGAPLPMAAGGSRTVRWMFGFEVRDETYVATIALESDAPDAMMCTFRNGRGEFLPAVACIIDRENHLLRWTLLEGSIGSPGPGDEFEGMYALTQTESEAWARANDAADPVVEEERVAEPIAGFALGDPARWDELNPALAATPLARAAWHADPLATENLPDTLQVAGAVLGLLTFLAGALLVRRSRRAVRALLERIDRIERAHENDPRRALLELGRLESEVTRAFRTGRLREGAYQVASQRIASAASRLALRRDLGLDDGVPGDATRVPVRVDPRREAP